MVGTANKLPDDAEALKKLLLAERKTVGLLQKQINQLFETIRLARHQRFGSSSEKKHQGKASCSMKPKKQLMKLPDRTR